MRHSIPYENWTLSCETHGLQDNPAMLLIHGASSDQRIWHYLIEYVKQKCFVITLDLLGHGTSEKPDTAYNLGVWAKNVYAVIEHFNIEKAHLIGHSFGVLVAKQFYHDYQDRVHSLVILDGNLRQVLGEAIYNWMKTTLDRPDYESYMDSLNANKQPFCLKKKDSELVSEGVQNTPKYVLKGQLESMKNGSDLEVHLKVPVLAIYAQSHEWNEAAEKYLREFTNELQLHVWEDVSHFIMLEQPERIWEKITSFFNATN